MKSITVASYHEFFWNLASQVVSGDILILLFDKKQFKNKQLIYKLKKN